MAEAFGLAPLDGAGHEASAAEAEVFANGLTCLIIAPRGIAETEALLFEGPAFAKRAASLRTIVIAATLSPRYVRALRGRVGDGIALIDAPYTGSLRAAEEGRLSFFIGGEEDDISRIAPVFDELGHQATRMGGFGTAMAAKVMNDFLAASATALTRIALDWAEAQGIDEARLLEMTGDTLDGLLLPGHDLADPVAPGGGAVDCVTTLVREVETALDTALKGAHLTPPHKVQEMFRSMKSRALH
ncbi:NAD(P)-binding domain-containing protein [Defluviimonas salinarum]|nr:NAD(P)-binding domain-containing protein [Defluviimonas salinarum]